MLAREHLRRRKRRGGGGEKEAKLCREIEKYRNTEIQKGKKHKCRNRQKAL